MPTPTPETMLLFVLSELNVPRSAISLPHTRDPRTLLARNLFTHICRSQSPPISFPLIARTMGLRSHSSAHAAHCRFLALATNPTPPPKSLPELARIVLARLHTHFPPTPLLA